MAARIVAGVLGVVIGLASMAIAVSWPAYTFAGSPTGTSLLLLAGWGAIGAGLLFWSTRPGVVGPALVTVGIVWLIAEWDNPGVGSAAVFTAGLVLHAAVPVLVAFVVLTHPSGRFPGWPERLVLGVLLVGPVLLLGVGAMLFYDPQSAGCTGCASNLLLLDADRGAAVELGQLGIRVGAIGALAAVAVAVWRLTRASTAKRLVTAPALLAGAVCLAAAGWAFVANRNRSFVASGPLERRLWYVQAAALLLIATTIALGRWRNHRTRQGLVDVVVGLGGLGDGRHRARLRDALALRLGDPTVQVAYAIGDGRWANLDGEQLPMPLEAGPTATALLRDGERVAMILHRPGLLDDADLVTEVASTAGLLLDNERLQAEARVTEAELRASRARIVETGDTERRRLERDLHDGAQQHLVGLLLGLRLLRSGTAGNLREELGDAEQALAAAVDELRELANGIHPAALGTFGLPGALAALAERASHVVTVTAVPDERLPPAVETAAFQVVATVASAGDVCVDARVERERLRLDATVAVVPTDLLDVEDRVGALDGRIALEPTDAGGALVRVELPCAS